MCEPQRSMLGKQPARILLLDLSPHMTADMGEDVCVALENMFVLACNLSGPVRIPFFSIMTLSSQHEIVLPFSYVRNNFPRIQTAICDVQTLVSDTAGMQTRPTPSFYLALADACTQFRRQLHSTQQTGGICEQLEIVVMTCQNEKLVHRQVETAISTLDTEHLKRIQIVCLSSDDLLFDDLCITSSQSSQLSEHSSSSNTGLVEVISLQPDPLNLQNFFNQWLVDSSTDSEHMHILLPPLKHSHIPITIKCDLHERVIQSLQLPFNNQFTVHADSRCMKVVFPTTGKAMGTAVPVFKLQVISQVPVAAVCDSVVFGTPMIAQPTACWKIDWDDLERNQQMFKALCHTLTEKDQAMIAQLLPNDIISNKPSKSGTQPQLQPYGHFVLAPSSNGTLLVKALATQELMLPYNTGNQTEEISADCQDLILESLDQVEELDVYNPLQHTSNLFESLKSLNKKPTNHWQQKRPLPQGSSNYQKKVCNKTSKQLKKQPVVDIAPDDVTPLSKRVLNKMGNKSTRRALYTQPDNMFTLDSEPSNNMSSNTHFPTTF